MGWNRPGCSVGRFEHFISSTILVNIFCCFIPIFRRGIGRTSVGHCSNGVLDLRVQTFLEFYHHGFGVCIPRFRYQIYELVQVVVNRLGLLVVTGRLQFFDSRDISMSQTEILLEFFSKFFPIKELGIPFVFLFP